MTIHARQNEPQQLRRLGAQRNLYTRAKTILGTQIMLGGVVAFMLAIAVLFNPALKIAVTFYGLIVALAGELWLVPWQKKLREKAAKIQEAFDCYVLGLSWHELKAGKPIDGEVEVNESARYQEWARTMPPIENWYSTEVDHLPIAIGRVCCQRSNCWWDATQRRMFGAALIIILMLMLLAVLVVGLVLDLSLGNIVVSVAAPLAPAALICLRQYREHADTASRLDFLKDHALRLFDEACRNPEAQNLADRSRALQDEIFDSRKRSPPLFDWIFKIIRTRQEVQMNFSSGDLARLAEQRLASA